VLPVLLSRTCNNYFWFQIIKINETDNELALELNSKEELEAILNDPKAKDLPVCVISVAGLKNFILIDY
jgi:hypothetical protein